MKVGVLGAGQLGRMLALAGYPLGMRFRFLDPASEAPASHLAEQVVGEYEDEAALDRFVEGLDVVTYEFENVPVETVRRLASRGCSVYPPPEALEVAQDRLVEKRFLRELGIATPEFASISTYDDLKAAVSRIGLPAVLKTRRMGYDGKGQRVLREPGDVTEAWESLGGRALILESFVSFERELSILAVRGRGGESVCYPLVQNEHRTGILRRSVCPAPMVTPELQSEAEDLARRVLDRLGYVGVLAIELFEVEGKLLANEMAPRVHNSGHWTLEGAETSQFENHLRSVVGLPLGSTAPRGYSVMLNLIGKVPDSASVLAVPGAHLHLYGKAERPGRKLGHITLSADDPQMLPSRVALVEELLREA